MVGNTDNMSVRQLANDSLDSLEMASESEEARPELAGIFLGLQEIAEVAADCQVHLGSIADGPGASYTAVPWLLELGSSVVSAV